MIPKIKLIAEPLHKTTYGTLTYKVVFRDASIEPDSPEKHMFWNSTKTVAFWNLPTELDWNSKGRLDGGVSYLDGMIDGLASVTQAVLLILQTERYQHIIYSWDYGLELLDLYGKPMPYVLSELPRRIREALVQDNRVTDVVDITTVPDGNKVTVGFKVLTVYGNIDSEMEIRV